MTAIHVLRPFYRTEEVLAEIRECLESGWTGLGFKTLAFEEAWRAYSGLPHAHMTNSATAGLHLALAILKQQRRWRDNDEVITTPLTFVSTNHAILYCNLRPVFADVDQYLCLDPESVESRITRRTRAVMFVGMAGNTGQLPAIIALCRRYGLALIVDAAHMAGTRLNGVQPSPEADATVFSFHSVKNLPTADAGMLCFRDAEWDTLARQWSWLGIDKSTYDRTVAGGAYAWEYDVPNVGFKSHGNSIMGAMGLVALKYLDVDNQRRREIAAMYDAQLAPAVERVPMAPGCESSRHLYQVLVPDRKDVMGRLRAEEVYCGSHYRLSTDYPMHDAADHDHWCPYAINVSRRVLSLPLHLCMTDADVSRVADVLNRSVQ